jgi:hypothetical protein
MFLRLATDFGPCYLDMDKHKVSGAILVIIYITTIHLYYYDSSIYITTIHNDSAIAEKKTGHVRPCTRASFSS